MYRPAPALLAAALLLPPTLGAQDAAGPLPQVDSLLVAMDGVQDLAVDDAARSRCGALEGQLSRLCRALVSLGRVERGGGIGDVEDALLELHEMVRREPDWAAGWYVLGVVRLRAAELEMIAKPGPRQTVGVSWVAGAGHALAHAVTLDPDLQRAIDALALAPVPREGAKELGPRDEVLHRVRDRLGPLAMVGAARVERAMGHRTDAATLFEMAAATGEVDSGVVMPELARELHVIGRAADGRAALFAGAGTTSEAGQKAYREELAWTAEADELESWDTTAPADRPAWLKHYWYGRDAEEGHDPGGRLAEHYQRVEHAWEVFRLSVPPSGRHQMSVRSGGIDTFIDKLVLDRLMGAEGLAVAENPWDANSAVVRDIRSLYQQIETSGLGGPLRTYLADQELLDDRGVVWIRHGAPTRAVRSTGGEALEVWAYDRPSGSFHLSFREEDFDGQAGASTLVPTLIDVPARYRDQFCGIVRAYCTSTTDAPTDVQGGLSAIPDPLNPISHLGSSRRVAQMASTLTDNGRITPATVDNQLVAGKEMIELATTTDAFPPVFTEVLHPIVQLHGVTRAGGSRPLLLAAFAIPAHELAHYKPPAAGGRTVYSLHFRLSAVGPDGEWVEVDTVRHFAVPEPLGPGQYLRGTLELPVAPGSHRTALRIDQADGRGAVAGLSPVAIPATGGGLAVSSLILGSRDAGFAWAGDSRQVPLNTLNAFEEKSEVAVYYQLIDAVPGRDYRVAMEFYKLDDRPDAEPLLRVAFRERARERFSEVERSVDLEDLKAGRYRLRVTVSDADGGASAATEGRLTVVKR